MRIKGNLVNVLSGEVYPAIVEVRGERISNAVRLPAGTKGYILPGLIDAHVHIESSMLCPSRFAQLAIPHGVTSVIADPHEIANVMGKEGIYWMRRDALRAPLRTYFMIPSCVPATKFETSGARLDASDVDELLFNEWALGLGEVMNWQAVLRGDKEVMTKIGAALEYGQRVDGHAPGLRGEELARYIAAGITTDHECFDVEEAKEKLRLGLRIMIRQGSVSKSLEKLLGLDYRRCLLVSDDMHVQDLERGYLDRILAEAVALGIDPIDAIRMVTLNPAEHYGLGHGVVMPGMLADLTIVRDLKEFEVKQVFIGGKLVARDGKPLFRTVPRKAPPTSFKVRKKDARDFMLKAKERSIRVRVIDATDTPYTGELAAELQVVDGRVVPDVKGDVLQLAVVERYGHERAALGFVKGFGLREGAIASSIAHDSHNIVVVGATPSAMVKAVNEVIGMRGGLAVVSRQGVVGLELPIAGLMSNKRPGIVARKLRRVMEHVKKLGCKLDAPFMTLSFLTLPVIPKLKLTDKGLFDVTSYKFVSVKLGG